jgi:hypothetical protein
VTLTAIGTIIVIQNNELLKETKADNTFNRRLSYERQQIDFQMKCQELGLLQKSLSDYTYDSALKRCLPNNETVKTSEGHTYTGRLTESFILDYRSNFIEPTN